MFGGRITSFPYRRKREEFFREGFGVTWSAHNAFMKALCYFFWLEKIVLLIIQITLFFVDSTRPFP